MEPRSDQFIIDNAERYKRLVAAFKPNMSDGKGATTAATREIVVSTRVRPMLEEELAQGFPSGIYIRGKTNIIDLHALKQPVRGLPTITVSLAAFRSLARTNYLPHRSPRITPSTMSSAPSPSPLRSTSPWSSPLSPGPGVAASALCSPTARRAPARHTPSQPWNASSRRL